MKKVLEIIAIIAILMLSLGAFANSKKEMSKDTPKYEIESEILNFKYTKMAYPLKDDGLGFKVNVSNVNKAPKKRVDGKPEVITPNYGGEILTSGLALQVLVIFPLPFVVIMMIFHLIFEAHGKKKEEKRIEENNNKFAENTGLVLGYT